jgi:hypothetical protein
MESIKILNPSGSVKLTKEQCEMLGLDITQDLIRAEYETVGPWNIIKSFRALCVSNKYENSSMFTKLASTEIFGMRNLSRPKESSYRLEGYVSINGKKYSAFTCDMLIEVEGKLINVQTINARMN